jgi:hypothetical protein
MVGKLAAVGVPIGFAPMTAYGGGVELAWIACGFLAVWLLPNTQQLLRDYDPAFDRVAAPRGPTRSIGWSPSAALGVGFASAALFVTFVVLQGKAGEFIYFQF